MNTNTEKLSYQFEFEDRQIISCEFELDENTLEFQRKPGGTLPSWTRLTYEQCEDCPLNPEQHSHCPIAVNLYEIFEKFRNLVSHTQAHITITTNDRTYSRTDDVQRGLSSLLGVLMATSGCPVMDKLRPMVRTHLPFSSMKETLYRVISMYIMAQHFRERRGLPSEYSLSGLRDIYNKVGVVNHGLSRRMRHFYSSDANINAIVILNCMAEYTAITLEDDMLEELEVLFRSYYDEP
jgi:hypothetical protein